MFDCPIGRRYDPSNEVANVTLTLALYHTRNNLNEIEIHIFNYYLYESKRKLIDRDLTNKALDLHGTQCAL